MSATPETMAIKLHGPHVLPFLPLWSWEERQHTWTHRLIYAPLTEGISQSSASAPWRTLLTFNAACATICWKSDSEIGWSCPNPGSQPPDGNPCRFHTELMNPTRPSIFVTLDTSHLAECLCLEVMGVGRRHGDLRGAKIDQSLHLNSWLLRFQDLLQHLLLIRQLLTDLFSFDLLHSSYMWLQTTLSCGKTCQTMQIGTVQDSDFARDLEDSKSTSDGTI